MSRSHRPEQSLGTIALKSLTLPLDAQFLSLMKFSTLVLDSCPVQPISHRPEICDTILSGLCGNLHIPWQGGSRGRDHHIPEASDPLPAASWGRVCEWGWESCAWTGIVSLVLVIVSPEMVSLRLQGRRGTFWVLGKLLCSATDFLGQPDKPVMCFPSEKTPWWDLIPIQERSLVCLLTANSDFKGVRNIGVRGS